MMCLVGKIRGKKNQPWAWLPSAPSFGQLMGVYLFSLNVGTLKHTRVMRLLSPYFPFAH